MTQKTLVPADFSAFQAWLQQEEKSPVTIRKYLHDAEQFFLFAAGQPVTKERTLAFKEHLVKSGYAIRSVNSMLASLNSFLSFLGLSSCRVKSLKRQREIFCPEEKELTKSEYLRLLEASKTQAQLNLVLQTIAATGIRVSELRYFTVEAVKRGEVIVRCKNKSRTVFVPGKLRRVILDYCRKHRLQGGSIFLTKNGNPLDRSNLWSQMKKLCQKAGVNPHKVFPHNLRKLFARTFYGIEKDIAKLADLLGHGSIETTRIYLMTTGTEHRRKLERLGLVI